MAYLLYISFQIQIQMIHLNHKTFRAYVARTYARDFSENICIICICIGRLRGSFVLYSDRVTDVTDEYINFSRVHARTGTHRTFQNISVTSVTLSPSPIFFEGSGEAVPIAIRSDRISSAERPFPSLYYSSSRLLVKTSLVLSSSRQKKPRPLVFSSKETRSLVRPCKDTK